jgi:transposase
LAILQRQLGDWDHVQQQIRACDADLQTMLQQLPTARLQPVEPAPAATTVRPQRKNRKKNGKASKNEPGFDLAGEQKRVMGVDLTRIDGIKAITVQTILSEAGLDMSKWATEGHFVSWIGLAPRNDISGGKVLSRKTRRVVSRLATALRMAATTLRESESYLGAQFRRLRTRLGAPKAITAMAAKLARLVYRMLKHGQEYVDRGTVFYEAQYREQQLRYLIKKAAQHADSPSFPYPHRLKDHPWKTTTYRGVSGESRRGTQECLRYSACAMLVKASSSVFREVAMFMRMWPDPPSPYAGPGLI